MCSRWLRGGAVPAAAQKNISINRVMLLTAITTLLFWILPRLTFSQLTQGIERKREFRLDAYLDLFLYSDSLDTEAHLKGSDK